MTDQEHTPEPWSVYEPSDDTGRWTTGVEGPNGEAVVFTSDEPEEGITESANAHRIVACVNALQGIRNPSAVWELVEAANEALDAMQRDDSTQQASAWLRLDAAITAMDAEEST